MSRRTITIAAPLHHEGREITSFEVRAPRLGELRKFGKLRSGVYTRDGGYIPFTNWDLLAPMLAAISDPALPEALFDQLSEADAEAIVEQLADFSRGGEKAGSPPPQTSSSSISG